jgi:hypothetical protein
MTVERLPFNDGWLISDVLNGYLVSRKYFFYTKKEAIALFKQEVYTNYVQ